MAASGLGDLLHVGQTLDHYRIAEEIGAGGMGVVYRAYDEHLARDVAIKVLPRGTFANQDVRKRFRNEALALSKLNHPNIATIHDFDSQEELDFLVMEYVPGETLRHKLSSAPLPESETRRLAVQIAYGLLAAHEQGLVHRDLKPENIRLTRDGRPKILDFGIAKLIEPLTDLQTQTNISVIAGTLPYMAPEQVVGGKVDQRADLFSFGVVLYEMATGQHPFTGMKSSSLAAAILQQAPVPPTMLNQNVSPELERIVLRCLEKQPEKRYQTAKELGDHLVPAKGSTGAPHMPWARLLRSRWAKTTAAVGFGVAALAVVASLFFQSQRVQALMPSDTIVLADFINSTSDPVFDDALNQALTVELEQSPFLKILPQAKKRDTLRLMGRSPEESLRPEIGRELCQRAGAKALVWGSIAPLGTHYVIGLTAAECSTGSHLATEQVQSDTKEAVLKVLDEATSRLRRKLGESLSSVQQFGTPLEQATTPSLEALKAYSLGRKTQYEKGNAAAISLYKRATELDPNFAVAYSALGIAYSNEGEPGLANQNFQRAYELRDRVSERERLRISAYYHSYLLGDFVEGSKMYELWAQAYPRDEVPSGNLGVLNLYLGQYEKAVSYTLEHLRLVPDSVVGYGNLMVAYTALNRPDDAKATYQAAMAHKIDDVGLHANLYLVAFLQDDVAEMQRQVAWAAGKPEAEGVFLSGTSDTEAYYGRLSKARSLSLRAIDFARRGGQKETAAAWQMNAALREVEYGNATQARKATSSALALASTRDIQILAALALARAGTVAEAEKMREELAKRFPHDTVIVSYWLPTIDGAIEISRGNSSKAIEVLDVTAPYELAQAYPLGATLYPVYLRAQADLLLQKGDEAAAQFQKILDHRSMVQNYPLGALARLGLARAYVLQRRTADARSAYGQFFTLWKDADVNIPILTQAKAEFSNLH